MDAGLLRKYVLQNAIMHDGKADAKAILGKVLAEDPSLKPKAREIVELAKLVVQEVNGLSIEEQKGELLRIAPDMMQREKVVRSAGLPPLPGASGPVVMRLAPYPSGPLHIGNSRMVLLNDEYVKRYKGRLILMFDDTIGSDEKYILPEAYDQIEDGLELKGRIIATKGNIVVIRNAADTFSFDARRLVGREALSINVNNLSLGSEGLLYKS